MTRLLPLLALALALPAFAQSGDRVFDETYPFRAGDELAVATSSASFGTSSGDLSFGDVEGDLRASTSSGDLRADLAKPGRVDISTGSGGVRLRAPASLAADLDLGGGSVRIDRDFRFAGEIRDRSAEGQIGGGSVLRVRTGSGTVSLSAR
ncbi:MAG: DUF4097 family beta strand repeat-containing protein [Bacteroidota bacterium]